MEFSRQGDFSGDQDMRKKKNQCLLGGGPAAEKKGEERKSHHWGGKENKSIETEARGQWTQWAVIVVTDGGAFSSE